MRAVCLAVVLAAACIPATDPQPATVQCLLPCGTPIKSCTCLNHQCTGSTTLL